MAADEAQADLEVGVSEGVEAAASEGEEVHADGEASVEATVEGEHQEATEVEADVEEDTHFDFDFEDLPEIELYHGEDYSYRYQDSYNDEGLPGSV